jgi:hypothetical protein
MTSPALGSRLGPDDRESDHESKRESRRESGGDSDPQQWRVLLPTDRRFVALPSRSRPLVVAATEAPVLSYVRTALLAAQPHSAVPDWAYATAREILRIRPLWWLMPQLALTPPGRGQPNGGGRPDTSGAADGSGLAGLLAAHGTRLLVLRHSHDPDARTLLLLFGSAEPWPTLAVKLPSGPAAALRVLAEAKQLRAVGRLPLGALRITVPEVVELVVHAGLPALVTTAQPGTPILVAYHRRGHTARAATVQADLAAAQTWLANFQNATSDGTTTLDLAPGTVDIFARFDRAESSRGTGGGTGLLPQLIALRRRLGRYTAPRTAVHGDFWPGNVLLHGGAVTGVVDWERFEPVGSPTRDLARFVLTYSYYLDGHTKPGHHVRGHPGLVAGDPATSVRYALDGSGWYPDLVRDYLRRGLARLGLPPECGRDAVLAEVAALAAEATDDGFRREQLRVFHHLCPAVTP